MKPTDEQLSAIKLFHEHDSLKINAFSGAGKTTTLQYIAESTKKSGLYLAFNRSIAKEAKHQFPSHVECSTTHSIAFRATPSEFKTSIGKMINYINANAVAEILAEIPQMTNCRHQ